MIRSSNLDSFGVGIVNFNLLQYAVVCKRTFGETIGPAECFYPASADPPAPAKGLTAALSFSAGVSALLQHTLPGDCAGLVAMEGAATISGDNGVQCDVPFDIDQALMQRQRRR